MTIVPDTKDWTWVLRRPCPECGFDTKSFARDEVAGMILANAASWQELLAGAGDVGTRPEPDKWSPLEYACHVRDVCRLFDYRLRLMLTEDDPQFANWDQNETAVEQRYWDQDPAGVARECTDAAETIAAAFGRVSGEQWQRPGRRSNGSVFTVDTFGRYFLHDLVHHRHDIAQ